MRNACPPPFSPPEQKPPDPQWVHSFNVVRQLSWEAPPRSTALGSLALSGRLGSVLYNLHQEFPYIAGAIHPITWVLLIGEGATRNAGRTEPLPSTPPAALQDLIVERLGPHRSEVIEVALAEIRFYQGERSKLVNFVVDGPELKEERDAGGDALSLLAGRTLYKPASFLIPGTFPSNGGEGYEARLMEELERSFPPGITFALDPLTVQDGEYPTHLRPGLH